MKQLFRALGYYGVCGGIFILSMLPFSVLYLFSDFAFFFVYYVVGYRRNVVVQNLSRSFPEKKYAEISRISKAFYRAFSDYFAEISKMFTASASQMAKHVQFQNIHIIDDYILNGKNVIVALGHCGNWEMLNIIPSLLSSDVYAAYQPLENKIFDRLMIRMRCRFGIKPIASDTVARHFLNKDNPSAAYIFLADQCPTMVSQANKCTFLNQETGMYKGIDKLAKKTDSAVVFFHVVRTGRGYYRIDCIPICKSARTDRIDIMSAYIRLLEKNIREEPHGWLWTHKRWKR